METDQVQWTDTPAVTPLSFDISTSSRLWASVAMKLIIWVRSSQNPQDCTRNWVCETATPSSWGVGRGASSWAQPDYLHRGGKWEAACPSLNIWQEKQDNCSVQVRPGQDFSCAFVWSETPNWAFTQMEPDSLFFWISSQQWEIRKTVCVSGVHVQKQQLLCLERD